MKIILVLISTYCFITQIYLALLTVSLCLGNSEALDATHMNRIQRAADEPYRIPTETHSYRTPFHEVIQRSPHPYTTSFSNVNPQKAGYYFPDAQNQLFGRIRNLPSRFITGNEGVQSTTSSYATGYKGVQSTTSSYASGYKGVQSTTSSYATGYVRKDNRQNIHSNRNPQISKNFKTIFDKHKNDLTSANKQKNNLNIHQNTHGKFDHRNMNHLNKHINNNFNKRRYRQQRRQYQINLIKYLNYLKAANRNRLNSGNFNNNKVTSNNFRISDFQRSSRHNYPNQNPKVDTSFQQSNFNLNPKFDGYQQLNINQNPKVDGYQLSYFNQTPKFDAYRQSNLHQSNYIPKRASEINVCRFWCFTSTGSKYCCGYKGVRLSKPGVCPIDSELCPSFELSKYHISYKTPKAIFCADDNKCPGIDKCCYDKCFKRHVCKPSYHLDFMENSYKG